jgi:UDP-glucose 6-dehydrogenase
MERKDEKGSGRVKHLIIGSGVIGKATGIWLATNKEDVYFNDINKETLKKLKDEGYKTTMKIIDTDVYWICTAEWNVEEAIKEIPKGALTIVRSTTPLGTMEKLQKKNEDLILVHNPEFLVQKTAVFDMFNPDRIIIGSAIDVKDIMKNIFKTVKCPIIFTDFNTSELIKYTSNCWLAMQISYWNEIKAICESFDVNPQEVANAVTLDKRISSYGSIMIGSPFGGFCLVAGTKLRTKDNLINVEDVKKNDLIYDGKEYTKVLEVGKRKVKKTISLTARGRVIEGSEDHIHYVYDINKKKIKEKLLRDVNVGEYVFIPKQKETNKNTFLDIGEKPNGYVKWWNSIEIDKDFARMAGLYLAEGCSIESENAIVWNFGYRDKFLATDVRKSLDALGLNYYECKTESEGTYGLSKCWRLRCRSKGFFKIMEAFGKLAHGKKTPLLPNNLAKHLIGGWLDGDGAYYDGTIAIHSESKELIRYMDAMFLSLGINPQIGKNGKKLKISMREDVKEVCSWTHRFNFDENRYVRDEPYASPTIKNVEGGWATKITKKEEILKETEVFTIETESNQYVANDILTHNCFPKDTKAFLEAFKNKKIKSHMIDATIKTNEEL